MFEVKCCSKTTSKVFGILGKKTSPSGSMSIVDKWSVEAMDRLAEFTGHVIVSGGGEIYRETLPMASTLHLSTIDIEPEGDVFFPSIPNTFEVVFEQHFTSNINYCYQIWKKG